jgi:4-hydroxybenzoate polyprenyltransferase
LEDVEGDEQYGCRTLPIVIGVKKSKWIVYGIAAVMIAFLIYFQIRQAGGGDFISVLNLFTTLEVPLAIAMYLLYKADSQ